MLKKTISFVLVCVISAICLCGCNLRVIEDSTDEENSKSSAVQSSAQTSRESSADPALGENTITPSMWRVTDADGNFIYMMGSIHAGDRRMKNLPDYFENAFSVCDSLAVEADVNALSEDLSEALRLAASLMYTDNTKIYDHIPVATYDAMVNKLKEHNMYMSAYDSYKPVMWTSLMENAVITETGLSTDMGLDKLLLTRADSEGKTIKEVESAELQLSLYDGLSDEAAGYLLGDYVEDGHFDQKVSSTKEMYELWTKGELDEKALSDDTQSEQSVPQEIMDELLSLSDSVLKDRNKAMAEKAEEYMKESGVVMFVVGSAHFYGDDGILKLMENDGCTVEKLNSESTVSGTASSDTEAAA